MHEIFNRLWFVEMVMTLRLIWEHSKQLLKKCHPGGGLGGLSHVSPQILVAYNNCSAHLLLEQWAINYQFLFKTQRGWLLKIHAAKEFFTETWRTIITSVFFFNKTFYWNLCLTDFNWCHRWSFKISLAAFKLAPLNRSLISAAFKLRMFMFI